jgi:hypothetical protein
MREYLLGFATIAIIFVWAVYMLDPEAFNHYVADLEPFVLAR